MTDKSNKTLLQWHEEFCSMQQHVRGLRPATIDSFRNTFRVFSKLTSEDLMPGMLTNALIIQFFTKLNTRERKVGVTVKSGIKTSTTSTYYSKLKPFFDYLVRQKIIEISPFDGIDKPKVSYEDVKYLKKEQVEKILTAIALNVDWKNDFIKSRNLAMIHILLFTGIRKGELLNLKVTDFDFNTGLVKVNGQTSKSKIDREVPINTRIIKIIKSYLADRKASNCPFFFVGERGERFTESGLKHLIEKIKDASNIRFHIHQFRHTFAMNMVNKGCDIARLQCLMGHKDIRQTSVYLRKMPSVIVRNTIELLDIDTLV
ncbi:tyrosine-type recombinase/integrase [Candidatus Microgenomates bacterium]|nr:tyrosine-type recombinase/integrase [Candidatus Microgenomates bacterium]